MKRTKKDKNKKMMNKKTVVFFVGIFSLLLIGVSFLMNSYSLNEPVKTVTIGSEKLNYETKDAGSVKINKSAEWTATGKARITFDVDTEVKKDADYTDVIFVLDTSGSMEGEKINQVKKDATELLTKLLENENNHAALVTFGTNSTLVSGFTNNKDDLVSKIQNLGVDGETNYYRALINVEKILSGYTSENNRECIVMFLTDGFPSFETPNEVGYYNYLKSVYPYVTYNTIQYELGMSVREEIRRISDYQYIADINTLNNILFQAYTVPVPYESLVITDYINNDYFNVSSVSSMKPSAGTVRLEEENGVPKVIWDLSGVRSGTSHSLTIDINLNEEHRNQEELYPTNKKEVISLKVGHEEETVERTDTPILKGRYQVIYEGNNPDGCTVSGVPEGMSVMPTEKVSVSKSIPSCEGYTFKGWKILSGSVKEYESGTFTMPENDVVIRAVWNKMDMEKTMDGEIYVYQPPTLKGIGSTSYNGEFWASRSSITKVVFEDNIHSVPNASASWDVSSTGDGRVMAHLAGTTVYIQGDGAIYTSSDARALFGNFTNLTSIEGMGYLNTSNATNMYQMFYRCLKLSSIDLSHFDTSNVTSMQSMFYGDSSLRTLNLSSFDTSKVTNMTQMFSECSNLSSVNVSSFNTERVGYMSMMFENCGSITSLDLSSFRTPSLKSMQGMFIFCGNLVNLNINNFDYTNVTDFGTMFYQCYKIKTTMNLNGGATGNWTNAFTSAGTSSGNITINYTSALDSYVSSIISQSYQPGRVYKGSLIA